MNSTAPTDSGSEMLPKPQVLVVDDTPDNLALMSDLLRDSCKVRVANSGERALRLLGNGPLPDLILLDIMMPGMDGYEVIRQLKANPLTRDIPVLFLTAKSEVEDERIGLELGAVDYLTKPVSHAILQARVKIHLALKAQADFLRDQSAFLEAEVARRTREVLAVQDVTIHALASLAETRDNETGNHIRRTQHYVRVLAQHLSTHPRFAAKLTDTYIRGLFKSAPLHDIGKVGIPDSILLKPGKLTDAEFEIMKTHTTLGRDALERAEQALGSSVDFLSIAKEIAYSHQEKYDGSGYPLGLVADAIPLAARLMAVADVYDALISRRVYKEPYSHEKSVEIMQQGRGRHFDPDVFDAFLALQDEFQQIAQRYGDTEADIEDKRHQLQRLTAPSQA
jgi:putative two-component system response regulator